MYRWLCVVIYLLPMLLVGCANVKTAQKYNPSVQNASAKARQAQASKINSWNIQGSLSLQLPAQRSSILAYNWQQYGSNYRIQLNSTLNLYQINLVGQKGSVTLTQANKQPLVARSPENLLQQAVGWSLPISNLYYWMRGIPAPGPYSAQYDGLGHITSLQQQGWFLSYLRYTTVNGIDLPSLISMQGSNIKARVLMRRWGI